MGTFTAGAAHSRDGSHLGFGWSLGCVAAFALGARRDGLASVISIATQTWTSMRRAV